MWDVLSADDDDAAGGKGADADEVGACGGGFEIERGVFILLGGEEAADGVVECDGVAGCAFDDYLSVALVDFGVEGLDVIDAVGVDVDGVVDIDGVMQVAVEVDGVVDVVVGNHRVVVVMGNDDRVEEVVTDRVIEIVVNGVVIVIIDGVVVIVVDGIMRIVVDIHCVIDIIVEDNGIVLIIINNGCVVSVIVDSDCVVYISVNIYGIC